MLLNSRLNDFNPLLLFFLNPSQSCKCWQWFSECNIKGGVPAIPQQWQCESVDIAYLVVDADYPATDKVNSRKQPLSPKSSIAVRLLRYLKNRFELHCNLWQAEHSNGGRLLVKCLATVSLNANKFPSLQNLAVFLPVCSLGLYLALPQSLSM